MKWLSYVVKLRKYGDGTYRHSLQPEGRAIPLANPTGVRGDSKTRAGQVDAKPTLGTIGGAVAIASLAVRNQLAATLMAEGEIVSWEVLRKSGQWSIGKIYKSR